jgi:hypothetical protein
VLGALDRRGIGRGEREAASGWIGERGGVARG